MNRKRRTRLLAAALTCALAAGAAKAAPAPIQALTAEDARHYAAAFDAAARGDFIEAQMQSLAIQDPSLAGYVSYDQLMHPKAHKASFEELSGWLGKFRDLPLAQRIFGLALRRKPAEAVDPPMPVIGSSAARTVAFAQAPLSDRSRRAREAFFSGDTRRALSLATAGGDRWIEGLAAYRLKSFDQAQAAFQAVADDPASETWSRAAAAYWGARAANAQGQAAAALENLKAAAQAPQTFYGMIAARELARAKINVEPADPFTLPLDQARTFIAAEPRAHRAAALAQLGRRQAAAEELRAGLALARNPLDRQRWAALGSTLGAPLSGEAAMLLAGSGEDFPLPILNPQAGFTLDKALVYAIVRQESRFDAMAVSNKGAVGLMQLTPEAAVRAGGDDKYRQDMTPLLDEGLNLKLGQAYFSWLMDRTVGYDLIRAVAAYNGGPGMVQRTVQSLGDESADPLLLLECLPPAETRNYVQKVLAGYWTYKAMFGEETQTLEALASGASLIDARLDLTQPAGAATQLSSQPLQTTLR